MAASVSPSRHGRPNVSVMTTASRTPAVVCSRARRARALASGSRGRSTTLPGSVLEASTPAAAITKPCRVSTMRRRPVGVVRAATRRTDSAVIASSRSTAGTTRPSALLTTLLVTTTTSPSRRPLLPSGQDAVGISALMSSARSSPARTSGRPGSGTTLKTRAVIGVLPPRDPLWRKRLQRWRRGRS